MVDSPVNVENVVAALLSYLDKELAGCCVVGDLRQLPNAVDGDIDLVVPNDSFSKVPAVLQGFCQTHRAEIVQVLHQQSAEYFVLSFRDCGDGPYCLPVDICTDYLREGRLFLTAHELLDGRRRATSEEELALQFHEPAPAKSFIYYLLKKVDKGELNDKHTCYLSSKWREVSTAEQN